MKLFVLPQHGVISPFPKLGDVFGTVQSGNPILEKPRLTGQGRTVLSSGHLNEDDTGLTNWGPRVWEQFGACCDDLREDAVDAGATICFWPRAAEVLCDPSACVAFLDKHHNEPFELLLDASAFLTEQMVGDAQDHLIRAYELLGGQERVVGVVLSNLASGVAAPLHRGDLDARMIIDTWQNHGPTDLPVLILADEPEAQARLFEQ